MSEDRKTSRREDALYLLLLVLFVFLANWRLIFTDSTYQTLGGFHHDFEAIHLLVMNYLHEFYLQDYFPLWFPYYSSGHPGLGAYLPALFLPNSSPFFAALEYPSSLVAFCIFNYLLIAIFSYMLFRRLGMSCFSSFFAASWNTLAGFTIWLSYNHHTLGFLPWFYLFMWSAVSLIRNHRIHVWLIGALAAAMMLLSGEAEAITYTLYFGGIWIFFYALFSHISARTWAGLAILIALIVGIGSLLSAIQVWPALDYLSRTVRVEGLVPTSYTRSFVPLNEVVSPIILLFSRKLDNIYLGAIPLFLASVCLLAVRRNPARSASLAVIIAVMLVVLGSPLGLSGIFYKLPLFSLFIRHFKLGFIIQFAFIVMTGLGLDYFRERIQTPKNKLIIVFILFGLINVATLPGVMWRMIAILLLSGAIWGAYRGRRAFQIFLILVTLADICSYLWHTPFPLKKPSYWPAYENLIRNLDGRGRAQVMYPALSMYHFERPYQLPVQVGAWHLAQSFDTWLSFPLKSSAKFFEAVEPWGIAPETYGYTSFNFNTFFKSLDFITPQNRHLINLANLRYIFCEDIALREAEHRPILSDPEYFLNLFNRRGLEPYTRELINRDGEEIPILAIAESGEFLYDSRFDQGSVLRFWVSLESSGEASADFSILWQGPGKARPAEIFRHTLKIPVAEAGVESGPFDIPLDISSSGEGSLTFKVEFKRGEAQAAWVNPVVINRNKTLRWIAGEGRRMAFENTETLERVRIVHEVITAENDSEAMDLMRDFSIYDPRRQAVLFTGAPSLPENSRQEGPRPEEVNILEYHQEHVLLEAELSHPGWLIISDTYYPGWRAYVDGQEERIYRADLTFRGLPLEPGPHKILFSFEPLDFRIGLWTNFATLIGMLVFAFVWIAQRRRSSC